MSAEKIGVRWNTYEDCQGRFVEKENFVAGGKCSERNSKSPRPPLPDLIPIRRSALVARSRKVNRDGHRYYDARVDDSGQSWTHNFMDTCQRKRQMREAEKVSIQERTLRDEDAAAEQGGAKDGGERCEEASVGDLPSVNPVFLWVTQNDTEIIDVRCEDYDKRNRIRLTKTASGVWKAIPRTHLQDDGGLQEAQRRQRKKKRRKGERKRKHRKEKKQKKRKHERCEEEAHLVASRVGEEDAERLEGGKEVDSGAHVLESGEKLETLASIERFGRTSEMNDRAGACTSENKARDENVSTMQQTDVVEMQQMQEQEHYINAIHDISHENEQQARILSASVYETFEVDTVVNCVQNSCKDNQEEPSLFQDTHILLDVDPTRNPSRDPCNRDVELVDCEKKEQVEEEEQCEEKFIPFMCKTITDDDAQQNFKQESFADNLNVTSELIETIREISVSNSEDLDLTDQCGENTMTGTELLDSLIEHSCEVNNISGNIDDVKQQTACNVEDDYNEEDELLLDSEPVANIISRLSDSPKCLSFTESGEIETILESSNNIFKIGTEQSLDDLSLTIKELTETKFMATPCETSQKNIAEITSLLSPDSCVEEMPKDLSCKGMNQHRSPSPTRPTSRGSDTIQSPQPSGLPPIPPSPDLYSQQSRMLHSLSVTSPKTADGGRRNVQENPQHQPEPLNLGICRKSASPTVSCSEEAKNLLSDLTPTDDANISEPVKKRMKSDSFKTDDAKSHAEKTSMGKDPDPLTQLRLLMSNNEWKVPSTLLVPKDRLNAVLASPAREIPLLLTTRPELRLPEAFAFPTILQDPDILVVSLTQLETILEKQEELFKLKDHTAEAGNHKKMPPQKFSHAHHNSATPERPRPEAQPALNQMPMGGKFDIDQSLLQSSIFNQMLWLPYFNHLRNQNMGDFMKGPNMRNLPGAFPDLFMLLAAQNNLNVNNLNGGGMSQNLMGCNNPLELALWQDAMLQESNMNMQHLQRLDRQAAKKYTSSKQNVMKMPQFQQKAHPMHCMSNTLGNFRFGGQQQNMGLQKSPSSPFPAAGAVAAGPAYSPRGGCHIKGGSVPPFAHPHAAAAQGGSKKSHPQSPQLNNFSPHFPPAAFSKSEFEQMSQHAMQKAKEDERLSRQKYQNYQEARAKSASYQSLLNLLNPSSHGGYGQEDKSKQVHATATASHQPVPQPKLKVKSGQHLLDPAAMQRRLLATDDLAEVGSTTSMSDDGPDANSSLWHPLFGRDLNNFNPQKGGGYISPWQWTTVTIAGE
ncbi:uncharacterized protein LOC132265735 [Phlebotomus argentipes]|uniref:uncharacterized protein LOC132265735 n=1 Tax=Phlebotomus argentipes TaxID=94469 RepID=UPI002892F98A|nr:uncharacterized protein LOC132265735 [Phlebotomus argentipes]